jgi:hypothetical protein
VTPLVLLSLHATDGYGTLCNTYRAHPVVIGGGGNPRGKAIAHKWDNASSFSGEISQESFKDLETVGDLTKSRVAVEAEQAADPSRRMVVIDVFRVWLAAYRTTIVLLEFDPRNI